MQHFERLLVVIFIILAFSYLICISNKSQKQVAVVISLHVTAFLERTEMCPLACLVLTTHHAGWDFISNNFPYAHNKMNWNYFQSIRKHMLMVERNKFKHMKFGVAPLAPQRTLSG